MGMSVVVGLGVSTLDIIDILPTQNYLRDDLRVSSLPLFILSQDYSFGLGIMYIGGRPVWSSYSAFVVGLQIWIHSYCSVLIWRKICASHI